MLTPNTILQNRYLIVRAIGQGGMGAVYLAKDQRLGSDVALKETFFKDDRLRKAFEREARLLASLRHPALPKVIDHFSEADGQFLVMEFIPGDDLLDLMCRSLERTAGVNLRPSGSRAPASSARSASGPTDVSRASRLISASSQRAMSTLKKGSRPPARQSCGRSASRARVRHRPGAGTLASEKGNSSSEDRCGTRSSSPSHAPSTCHALRNPSHSLH